MSKLVQVNVFGRLLNPTLIYFLETSTNYTKTLDTNNYKDMIIIFYHFLQI